MKFLAFDLGILKEKEKEKGKAEYINKASRGPLIIITIHYNIENWRLQRKKMARLPALLRRVQPEDVKAVATWGVAATTGALYLIQVFFSRC
ncbi:hypothetical protein AHAS_Ahas17G0162600 [Arachis hypogaea]